MGEFKQGNDKISLIGSQCVMWKMDVGSRRGGGKLMDCCNGPGKSGCSWESTVVVEGVGSRAEEWAVGLKKREEFQIAPSCQL